MRADLVLGLEVALLSLLEVDDVPDGLKIISLDVLVLEVESVLPDVDTDDGCMGFHVYNNAQVSC